MLVRGRPARTGEDLGAGCGGAGRLQAFESSSRRGGSSLGNKTELRLRNRELEWGGRWRRELGGEPGLVNLVRGGRAGLLRDA